MIAKSPTHTDLIQTGADYIRANYECNPVLTDIKKKYALELPDVLGWKSIADTCLVEVKVSVEDYERDRMKKSRRTNTPAMGTYRWYLCPMDLIDPKSLPPGWGLLYATEEGVHETVEAERWNIVNRTDEAAMLLHHIRTNERAEVQGRRGKATGGMDAKLRQQVQKLLADMGPCSVRDLYNMTDHNYKTATSFGNALDEAGFESATHMGVRIFTAKSA